MSVLMRSMLALALCVTLGAGPALAITGGGGDSGRAPNPDYTKAAKLVEAGDYAGAVPLLRKAVATDSSNADAYQPVEKGVIDRVSRHGEAYRGEGGFAILGDDEDDLNDQDGSSGRNKHEQGANSARHGLLRGAGADELAHQQR